MGDDEINFGHEQPSQTSNSICGEQVQSAQMLNIFEEDESRAEMSVRRLIGENWKMFAYRVDSVRHHNNDERREREPP